MLSLNHPIHEILRLPVFCSLATGSSGLNHRNKNQDSLILNVFLSAHPDDWQLFMNPNAYKAVEAGGPVLFIHSTAGDAGTGMGYDDYTLAREAGSLNAIRFMVNMAKGPRGKGFHPRSANHD